VSAYFQHTLPAFSSEAFSSTWSCSGKLVHGLGRDYSPFSSDQNVSNQLMSKDASKDAIEGAKAPGSDERTGAIDGKPAQRTSAAKTCGLGPIGLCLPFVGECFPLSQD
ncbi:MAG: hypothetical protein ACOX8T_12750, partial [Bacillota bacterium]|jgi:hypothetical protein